MLFCSHYVVTKLLASGILFSTSLVFVLKATLITTITKPLVSSNFYQQLFMYQFFYLNFVYLCCIDLCEIK